MDAYVGEVRLLPYTFAPVNWLDCLGQRVQISQYQALYSVIGTTYGGDGRTTFGLPDLRGRVAPGFGDDPTDSFDPPIGSVGGSETVTLVSANIPAHTHTLFGATQAPAARSAAPGSNYIGSVAFRPTSGTTQAGNGFFDNASTAPSLTALNPASIRPYAGQGQGHENRQPYLALRYCICVQGNFPSRP